MLKRSVTEISQWNSFSSEIFILEDYMLHTSSKGFFPKN
jgi:hypothetical protein